MFGAFSQQNNEICRADEVFFVLSRVQKQANPCCICFQRIDGIPEDIKNLYKTVWEISQKTVLKMAADRGAYIDQSQSLNIHIAEPNYGKLTSMHFYAWKLVCRIFDFSLKLNTVTLWSLL